MFEIKTYPSVHNFFNDNLTFLEQEEAANNLIIGIPNSMKELSHDEEKIRLVAVHENDQPIIAVAQTPPRNLLMYSEEVNEAANDFLIDFLLENKYAVNGVVGPLEPMKKFSDQWTIRTGQQWKYNFRQLAYQLDTIIDVPISKGEFRLATAADLPTINDWFYDFLLEALPGEEKYAAAMSAQKLKNKEVYLWDNGEVVSMACASRPTRNCVTVNFVYTPKSHRGRGYASSVTHHLTRLLLKQYPFCALFTDMSNPTSNSIYQKIGYQEVARFCTIDFV